MAIRVGVIGAGSLGATHLESLVTFPEVQIATVCDQDRSLAESVAEPYGANAHINFRTVIEDERLDAVFVCVPPFAHGEPEMLAARAGIHVFIEPPVALNAQKTREVQKEIETAGVIASVGYTWRYLSGVNTLKNTLAEHKIAMLDGWRFLPVPGPGWRRRREASGGLFMQSTTDIVDLMRHLAGEVTTVCAMAYGGITAAKVDDHDIEDVCTVALSFRSGAIAQILCSDVQPCENESGVCVIADGLEATLSPEQLQVVEPGITTVQDHAACGLREAHAAFLKAVSGGDAGLVRSSYGDAAITIDVALAVRESIETGRVISL